MARISLLFCFSSLVVFGTILNAVSAHTKLIKSVPQKVDELEAYVQNEVINFVTELEKNCQKTKEHQVFFQKLKDYTKYACPILVNGQKSHQINKTEMDNQAGKLFHAMVALHAGKVKSDMTKTILRGKEMETIQKFKILQATVAEIVHGQDVKKGRSKTLTLQQQTTVETQILDVERTIKQMVRVEDMGEIKFD